MDREPPKNQTKGRIVLTAWLKKILKEGELSKNTTADEIMLHVTIYITVLIGLSLMPEKSNNITIHSMWALYVQDFKKCGKYSWGSVVLAFILREMCKVVDVNVEEM